jgi:hypothetical protein
MNSPLSNCFSRRFHFHITVKDNGKSRAFARFAFYFNSAAIGLGPILRHHQPQPDAARLSWRTLSCKLAGIRRAASRINSRSCHL